MTALRVACLVLAVAAAATAQTVLVPNPSFENGDDSPAGWALSGGKGEWLSSGEANGDRAVAVTGEGKNSNRWHSDPLPMEPGCVYRLTFRARRTGTGGGTPVTGPDFCNRDLGGIPDRWDTYTSIFVVPRNLKDGRSRLHFGQWQVAGTVAFDDVHLCRATPLYVRQGGLELGEGEMLRGTEYTFAAPFGGVSRSHARPLASHTAGFNSNRWTFGAGDEVVYRHALAGRSQTTAEISVDVSYHNAGELEVAASPDGNDWTPLGTLGGVTGGSWPVPKGLLPAEAVWIRLRARPAGGKTDGRVSLQVAGYTYGVTVTGPPATLIGRTRFVAITQTDPRLKVAVLSIGDAVPGGANQGVLHVTNTTGKTLAFLSTVTVDNRPPPVADFVLLQPGEHTFRPRYALPGPGEHTLHIRLVCTEPMGGFDAEVPIEVAGLHAAHYGERLPGATDVAGLWWCPSGWKVSRVRGMPEAVGKAIRIAAARNEADAAQLVVRPETPLKGLTVRVSALAGPDGAEIPAGAVEILKVRYVLVSQPTDAAGCVGWWPDPMPPLTGPLDLEAGRNQPFWVRVTVPKDAKAGTYRGWVHLKADDYTAEVPMDVRVFGFGLPDRMTCQTAFGLRGGNIWRYQNLTSEADKRAVFAKYLANLAAHHISPYDPAPMDPMKVTWPKGARKDATDRLPPEEIVPTFDFSAWDRAMARAFDVYHFNSLKVSVPGMGGGSFHRRYEPSLLGHPEDTPEYKAAFAAYCRGIREHLRQKGWLPHAYVYWFDEPGPKDYAFVMNGFRKLKESMPNVARMLTEQVEPKLVGGPNLWCPVSHNYDHKAAEQRRAEGDRFWWYVCCGPKTPYAGLFIDHPATELRVWLWQTWKRKIEGVLIWSTNYWTSTAAYPDPAHPQDPYEDPMGWVSGYSTEKGVRRAWGNGDGRFLYPPESCADAHPPGPVLEGPVDSLRWEMLRDGLEDYEYLVILRRLLAEKGGRLTAEARREYEALLAVPEAISKDMTHFTADPGPIEARRKEIAEAIEALGRK